MHDALNSKINIQYEPYNDNQKYELRKQIKTYIDNENEEIPVDIFEILIYNNTNYHYNKNIYQIIIFYYFFNVI